MLRLVREGEVDSHAKPVVDNALLRSALDRMTRGKTTGRDLFILDPKESELLYKVLNRTDFTHGQLDQWIDTLMKDHPWWRKNEEIEVWVARARAFILDSINDLSEPKWLRGRISQLDHTAMAMNMQRYQRTVVRWALVHLLTTPAHAPSGRATG